MLSSKAGKTLGSPGVDIGPDVGEELVEVKLEVSFEEEEDIKPPFSVARYKTHYHNPHLLYTSNH